MAVVIRLQRTGKAKQPHYRVVAIDKTRQTRGKALEILGHYHPTEAKNQVTLDMARVEHWVKNGAKPSPTVAGLIVRNRQAKPA